MTDAINNPVTRRRQREVSTDDLEVGQPQQIDWDAARLEHDNVIEPVSAEVLHKEYMEALAFDREPVEIVIGRSTEKHAPLTVDCWVNGKGAEVFQNGKWVEYGWLPMGINVVTRRMYVEVLARSKVTTVRTPDKDDDISVQLANKPVRNTMMKTNFSIVRDDNPKGRQWIAGILAERG